MIKEAIITQTTEDSAIDLGEIEKPYPKIPDGLYDVVFVKAHKMSIKKSQRLITYWRIQDLAC